MNVGIQLNNLLPLDVRKHHESIHRSLDVVWRVLLCLKVRNISNLRNLIVDGCV